MRDEEQSFAELLSDGYLRTDRNGVIRRANQSAAELLGRDQYLLCGKPLVTFVHFDQRRAFRALVGDLPAASDAQQWSFRLVSGEEERGTVRVTVAPMHDVHGTCVGARWLLRRAAADEVADVERPVPVGGRAPVMRGFYGDLLGRAGGVLASSLDPEATLDALARLLVPRLADLCLVDLVESDGSFRRVVVHGAGGIDDVALARLRRHPPLADGSEPAARAAATGERVHLGGPSLDELGEMARDAEHLSALELLQPRAWLAVPLIARGQVLGTISLVTSESGRTFVATAMAAVEELARRAALSVDNARLYRLAQHASEAKSAFLATISHELRTPLTAVLGYSELLRDGIAGPLSERQDDFVQRIRESSDHLLRLVEEVLSYARLEAREVRVELERIELSALVDGAATLITPQARIRGLDFVVNLPHEPIWFLTDPVKVRQILVNLLGNAVKFTDTGAVTIRAWATDGTGDQEGKPRVHFEVRDTGIGIPERLLPRIFDPFWQVEHGSRRSRGGAGLGLSVVRQLALLLGGDVEVESVPGAGTRFLVWLPLRESEPEPVDATAQQSMASS